ncbi:MAG: hypothetical protein M1828_006146 [Chrysothrix sp. TS-e1954]|nr:MAG: hypothetical protein M1828_006146 [Chrysothrix sp. TS-e1954]
MAQRPQPCLRLFTGFNVYRTRSRSLHTVPTSTSAAAIASKDRRNNVDVPTYLKRSIKTQSRRLHTAGPSRNQSTGQPSSKDLDAHYASLTEPPPSSTPVSETTVSTPSDDPIQKARVVFGSRLAGPAARRRELDAASRRIAGVLVPPKPEEPDNCCMSGCVNCVWDRYGQELEEWSASVKEVGRRRKERDEIARAVRDVESEDSGSMDDDGGGSGASWESGGDVEEVLGSVPVGIREFMRQEKRLKERKLRRYPG